MSADWALFNVLNGLAGRSPMLDNIVRFLMNDYALTTALVLLLLALWFAGESPETRARNQRGVLSAIASMFLGNLIVKAMNLAFYRYRPFAFNEVTLLFYYPSDSSFPSNAACVGFAIATAVWLHNRTAGWISYLLALLLGVSRVVGGVHYPSDILGGAVVGVTVAYLVAIKTPLFSRLWSVIIRKLRQLLLA